MKKRYEIELRGCDDSTFFQIGLTDKEYILLKRISDKSKQLSEYDCMPRLFITPSYVALSTPQISKQTDKKCTVCGSEKNLKEGQVKFKSRTIVALYICSKCQKIGKDSL